MSALLAGFDLSSQGSLLTIVAASCIALIAGFQYNNYLQGYWQRLGVKGPKPWPVVGHLLKLLLGNREYYEKLWVQKYGRIYGIYQGLKPRLVVADPEVIRQITIKDFDNFINHGGSSFENKFQESFIFVLKGDRWKKVRALMSPTFTSGKLKRMFKFMDGCADDLIGCIKEHLVLRDNIINAKDVYSLYTLDAISTCCYGLKMERDKATTNLKTLSMRNEFARMALKIFDLNPLRLVIALTVPQPILKLTEFHMQPEKLFEPLADRLSSLIMNRKKASGGKKFEDYLQLLIDARLGDKLDVSETDKAENHHAGLSEENIIEDQKKMVEQAQQINSGSKIELTDMEMLSNAIFIMIVGLETTGTLLTSMSYALAFHQDVQEKLYQEIMKIAEFDESKKHYSFDYEALTSCHYLDSVISETLRISPPVLLTDRRALEEYTIDKYNITIAKDQVVMLAIYALQNDPEYWEEPEKFNPERFMPGNREKIVPGTYLPFGYGPRHCIGMRFSLTETKLGIAKIIANFRIEPAPNTVYPAPLAMNIGLRKFKNPVVRMIPRV